MTGARVIRGRRFTGISFPCLYEIEFIDCRFEDCIFDRLDNCWVVDCHLDRVLFETIHNSLISGCFIMDCSSIAYSGYSRITRNTYGGNAFSGTTYPKKDVLPPAMDWVHAQVALAVGVFGRIEYRPEDSVVEDNYHERQPAFSARSIP